MGPFGDEKAEPLGDEGAKVLLLGVTGRDGGRVIWSGLVEGSDNTGRL